MFFPLCAVNDPLTPQFILGPDPCAELHFIIQHVVKNSPLLPVGNLSWIPGGLTPPHTRTHTTTTTTFEHYNCGMIQPCARCCPLASKHGNKRRCRCDLSGSLMECLPLVDTVHWCVLQARGDACVCTWSIKDWISPHFNVFRRDFSVFVLYSKLHFQTFDASFILWGESGTRFATAPLTVLFLAGVGGQAVKKSSLPAPLWSCNLYYLVTVSSILCTFVLEVYTEEIKWGDQVKNKGRLNEWFLCFCC